MLDLIFDAGADINVLYPSAMDKGGRLQFDGTVSNAGTGGTTLRQTSHDNRVGTAGLRWDHEPVMYVEKQADAADGILGYRVFEDRVVEIDYDRMLMIVHDALPPHASGFAKTAAILAARRCGSNFPGKRRRGAPAPHLLRRRDPPADRRGGVLPAAAAPPPLGQMQGRRAASSAA
jgi:hypothetical protein